MRMPAADEAIATTLVMTAVAMKQSTDKANDDNDAELVLSTSDATLVHPIVIKYIYSDDMMKVNGAYGHGHGHDALTRK
jgi:hypothetical protein